MKKKHFVTSLLFFLITTYFSLGQEIASYSSVNNAGCSGIIANDANLTAVGICRGPGVIQNAGLNYNSRNWTLGAVIDPNDYLEWTLTPNAGYQVDLTTMDITYDRSATGPSTIEIQVDSGSGFVTLFTDATVSTTSETNNGIDLSAIAGITTAITFRLYGYNATTVNGTFDVEENTATNKGIIINGSVTPDCSLVTTWDGTAWTPVTPDNTYSVIIDGNYSTTINLPGSFDACSLTVNADLTVNGTDFVQVTNDITINNNATLLVASEANLVQTNDLATVTLNGTGIGVLQKTTTQIDAFYEYTYWSSPFANETIAEAGSGMDLVPTERIFEYNAANYEDLDANGFDDNSDDWAIASGPMVPGKGYAAFAQDNGMGFPQTQTYTFDGVFNNGSITALVTTSANAADPNWNFLGNPYPSAINADVFLTHPNNSDLMGTIYLWTHNSPPNGVNPGPDDFNFSVDDYASYNYSGGVGTGMPAASGGVTPTGIIATGQGFFIEAINGASPSATFNNSMRVGAGNDNFFRVNDRIWLNLENDYGAFSQILIAFIDGATNGVDRLYDGKRLDADNYISFFSLIDNSEEHYAIQGRESLTEEEIISLGIKNLVEGEREYKISIDNIEGVLETSEVFLIDKLLDITHDLNEGEYRFNSEQGIYKERFELLLKSTLLIDSLVEDELIIVKKPNSYLAFSTTNNSDIVNIQLFDILGRLLYDINVKEEQEASYKFNNLNQTIFVAKATLANGKILTKKGLK